MKILSGITEVIESARGSLSLLILIVASVALFTKHLDGLSYAGVVSSIVAIYNYTHMLTECAAINQPQGMNQGPTP